VPRPVLVPELGDQCARPLGDLIADAAQLVEREAVRVAYVAPT
jgi:hypothetical protein